MVRCARPFQIVLVSLLLASPISSPARSLAPVETGPLETFQVGSSGQDANTATSPAPAQTKQGTKEKKDNDKVIAASRLHNPVLWREPGDISALNLFYGQGGESRQPVAPFTFEAEAYSGTNPKFDARDANGKRWRVKLAEEARPEVVASRLLWAVGFFANDDYLLHDATVDQIELKRGKELVHDGHVTDARFARKPGGQSKIGIWQWKNNPFMGTREFNGLRTMMAVINNWDLKDVNNAVFHDDKNGRDILLVNDVGASFATTHLTNSRTRDKGNVESYKSSKFILKQTDTAVDFATPAPPTGLLLGSFGFTAGEYFKRHGMDWIGRDIPRADVKWMGSLLAQLSHQQLVDAFRAGNFSPEEIEEYVGIVENRIAQLKAL